MRAFLIAKRVLLVIGLGAQYHAAYVATFQGPPRFSGFYPQLDLNLGYAFSLARELSVSTAHSRSR